MLQVACQRLILLVAACSAATFGKARCNSWPEEYMQLLLGVSGENICTKEGRIRADTILEQLLLHHAKRPVQVNFGQDGIDLAIISSTVVQTVSTPNILFHPPCFCSRSSRRFFVSVALLNVRHGLLMNLDVKKLLAHTF